MHVETFSEIGCRRESNEDAHWVQEGLGFFVVSDGVGGLATGELAARKVVDACRSLLREEPMLAGEPEAWIRRSLERANRSIAARSEAGGKAHGATAVLAACRGELLRYGWVGDSRLYLLREGVLRQLSSDHSRYRELVKRGVLSEDRVDPSLRKGALTRCLGYRDEVQVDEGRERLVAGDRLLLCTDGVSDVLPPERLAELMKGRELATVSKAMRDAVFEGGAPDNATAILVELEEQDLQGASRVDAEKVLEALASERSDHAVPALEGRKRSRARSLKAFFGELRRAPRKRLILEGLGLAAFLALGLFLPELIELFGRKLERVAGVYTVGLGLILWLLVLRLRLR